MCGAQTNSSPGATGSPGKSAMESSHEPSRQRTPILQSQPQRQNAWEWTCAVCTYVNCCHPCAMCGRPRGSRSPEIDADGHTSSGSAGKSTCQENSPTLLPAAPIVALPAEPQADPGRELLAALKRGFVMPPAPKTPPPSPPQQRDEIEPGRKILAALKCNENKAKLGPSAHLMAVLKCGADSGQTAGTQNPGNGNPVDFFIRNLSNGGNRWQTMNRGPVGYGR